MDSLSITQVYTDRVVLLTIHGRIQPTDTTLSKQIRARILDATSWYNR
jgi:hypothetical protein